MTYRTARCPHCKNIVKKEENPYYKIGNPFEQCPWCQGIYREKYKGEWITKSPIARFFYYVQIGVWARAIFIPIVILAILSSIGLDALKGELLFPVWGIAFILWMAGGYFLHRWLEEDAVAQSLKRTEVIEYVELLKAAGYRIYPIEGVPVGTRSEKQELNSDAKKEPLMEKKTPVLNEEQRKKAHEYMELAEKLDDLGDHSAAIEMYKKASDMGLSDADMALGYLYLSGDETIKNKERARFFFIRAQERGNKYASNALRELDENR